MTSQDVMESPYLVETILHYLSMAEILKAERVSKFWKAHIKSSPKLQRKLFLKPVTESRLIMVKELPEDLRRNNKFPNFDSLDDTENLSCHVIHPILGQRNVCQANEFKVYGKDGECLWSAPRGEDKTPPSWTRMFICQPPVEFLIIARIWGCSPPPRHNMSIFCAGGVTWGHVIKALRHEGLREAANPLYTILEFCLGVDKIDSGCQRLLLDNAQPPGGDE
ncbi:hypothetical protein B9Z65_8029 [Elsinoe australis]|uniref:F-box domain-containing protein n=1 Tax=Elsinoe australis TaxID=40998 RepID=A0A2P7YVV0_9PEZI|nr:hypothetical protein B9Z65_8029 [Elsinoe australis]